MKHYKFKFKYQSLGLKSTGNGTCKAENMDDAFIIARNKVASDFNGHINNVVILSASEYKPKKVKVKS